MIVIMIGTIVVIMIVILMTIMIRRTEIMSMCQLIGGPTGCLGAKERKNCDILTERVFFLL